MGKNKKQHGGSRPPTAADSGINEARNVDIRLTRGGIQFSIGPGPDGSPFIVRFRYETAEALAAALETNSTWVAQLGDYGMAYVPDRYGPESGALAMVDVEAKREVWDWGSGRSNWVAASSLLRSQLELEPLPDDGSPWEPESFVVCAGCGRPVFESEPTSMVLGVGPIPMMMCQTCALKELDT